MAKRYLVKGQYGLGGRRIFGSDFNSLDLAKEFAINAYKVKGLSGCYWHIIDTHTGEMIKVEFPKKIFEK